MYVLRETTGEKGCTLAEQDIFRGDFEEAQARMQEMINADMRATEGISCEIKHGEDYYSRIESETLKGYWLHIRWEDMESNE